MAIVFCTRCGHRVSTTAPKCPSCGVPPYRNRVASTASTDPHANPPTAASASRESAGPTRGSRIAGQLIGWTLAIVLTGGLCNVLYRTSAAGTESSPPATEPEAGPSVVATAPALPPRAEPAASTVASANAAQFSIKLKSADEVTSSDTITVTSTDPEPFTITRVVFNNRANAGGCDQSENMNTAVINNFVDQCEAEKRNIRAGAHDDCEARAAIDNNFGEIAECEKDRADSKTRDCNDFVQHRLHESMVQKNYLFEEKTLNAGDSAAFTAFGACGNSTVIFDIWTDRQNGVGQRFHFDN